MMGSLIRLSYTSAAMLLALPMISSFSTHTLLGSAGLRRKSLSMIVKNTLDAIGAEISSAAGIKYVPLSFKGGFGGGGGATVGTIEDDKGTQFFIKKGNMFDYDMLKAEFNGILEIYDTQTMRVPRPICCGVADGDSFVVFEKLTLGGFGDGSEYARKLAEMHGKTSPNGKFGWKMNNTIGSTFQPNNYMESWPEFWDQHRLGYMLSACKREGATFPKEAELRAKVKSILSNHDCVPSLVHGDLWSGNQGYTSKGEPVCFDPAVYYGDKEVDIAMTKLFGSNSKAFYDTYMGVSPLPEGYELRQTVYNLYHILNHYVLFGGGYMGQAQSMIERILSA